jgi:hypothetical protein
MGSPTPPKGTDFKSGISETQKKKKKTNQDKPTIRKLSKKSQIQIFKMGSPILPKGTTSEKSRGCEIDLSSRAFFRYLSEVSDESKGGYISGEIRLPGNTLFLSFFSEEKCFMY